MKQRPLIWLLLAELVIGAWFFSDALWGGSLLAPLDIASAMFSKYRALNPESSGVPANHYVIDQVTYDLPIQHTIYEAYRHGEIPWWDPYTYAGRPLLADAHINGTDPVRLLLYSVMPFEWAYNWTRVAHSLLTGLGLFLLLSHWHFRPVHVLVLALTYQFAGCQALFFGHPWIQASFLYYPFLWLAWDSALGRPAGWKTGVAALCVAGIFYSGNLQSHSYLVLFAVAIAWGYRLFSRDRWRPAVNIVLVSLVLGAALAAPVLWGQVEFFLLGVRTVKPVIKSLAWLSGLASLSAVYPWALGTFRTLDLGKFLGNSGLGFHLFIGSAGFVLSLVGLCSKPLRREGVAPRRTALMLAALYFFILSTPLLGVFYTRCAGMAVLGLIVSMGLGLEWMMHTHRSHRRLGWGILVLAMSLGFAVNIAGLVVYPRWVPKVRQMLVQRDAANVSLDQAPALRNFQAENLPNEITFRNHETVLAWISLVALGGLLLYPTARRKDWAVVGMVCLNLVPPLLFAHRFVPHQPMDQWRRLLAGGPEQQRVTAVLGGSSLRLFEIAPGMHEQLYPNAFPHLYGVRTVHGYSALQPRGLAFLTAREQAALKNQLADYVYESDNRGQSSGRLRKMDGPEWARFQWVTATSRSFHVHETGLNTIRLEFDPGAKGHLMWTDTFYPGWTAAVDGREIPIDQRAPCFSQIAIPADAHWLVLRFEPRGVAIGKLLVLLGILGLIVVGLAGRHAGASSPAARPTKTASSFSL